MTYPFAVNFANAGYRIKKFIFMRRLGIAIAASERALRCSLLTEYERHCIQEGEKYLRAARSNIWP